MVTLSVAFGTILGCQLPGVFQSDEIEPYHATGMDPLLILANETTEAIVALVNIPA